MKTKSVDRGLDMTYAWYMKALEQEGIPMPQCKIIAEAICSLHYGISSLDKKSLNVFMNKSLNQRLKDFITAESL